MFLAPSLTEFKQLFSDRLATMLLPDALGAYILVLANSLQANDLYENLAPGLASNFAELKSVCEKDELRAPPDDIAVFEKLLAVDPRELAVTRRIEVGEWFLLLNVLRSFRPARAATQVIKDLRQPFNPDGFNFNKPFLKPEIFWQGDFKKHELSVFYNKFPVAPYHLLVVPNPEQQLPQFLIREYHDMTYTLVQQQQAALPGLYLGYNSLGAYASVNHLHFHAVIREREFPVQAGHWLHRGGSREYPLSLKLFDTVDESWNYIEQLHAASQPYNVLYAPDGIYVLLRKAQNTVDVPGCMQGAGWPELSGEITFAEMPDNNDRVANDIVHGLQLLSVE